MKKVLFALAALIIAACGNKQAVVPAEGDETSNEVAFEAKDYYAAVERYLAEQIASQYAPGEYSVPVYQEVAVDDNDSTDIRIFGEYFETFQIHHSDGDEHERLRHDVLRAFVRDHGLTATMSQDYGWPAKELK